MSNSSSTEPRDSYEINLAALFPVGKCFVVLESNSEFTREAKKVYVKPELIWKPLRNLELLLLADRCQPGCCRLQVIAAVTLEFETADHDKK